MADRYWVPGGTNTWNTSNTANWSASPTLTPTGASVPTVADNAFFTSATTYSVTMTGALTCLDITVSAGTVSFVAGTGPQLNVAGSMSLVTGTVWSSSGTITFSATTTGKTINTGGSSLGGGVTFNGVGGGWTLASNLTIGSASTIQFIAGTFSTSASNYNITCGAFATTGTAVRNLNFNSSTITYSTAASGAVFTVVNNANLTFSASSATFTTAQVASVTFAGGGYSYGTASFTNAAQTTNNIYAITGANTFGTLSFASRSSVGTTQITFGADQTITTLALNAGTASAYRTFLASDTIGTQRTLTIASGGSVTGGTDYDFRDIALSGASISPTRAGNCLGNSGISFPAAKTVYYRNTGSNSWATTGAGSWCSVISLPGATCSGTTLTTTGSPALVVGMTIVSSNGTSLGTISAGSGNSWTVTVGGTFTSQTMLAFPAAADPTMFPLAQDAAVFAAGVFPASGSTTTVTGNFNIGTVDMSLRTTNTMSIGYGTTSWFNVYGNWIYGTGVTNTSGAAPITFCGRGSQTITSAGTAPSFRNRVNINTPGGSVTLADNIEFSQASTYSLAITQGTFNSNGYNVNISSATGIVNLTGTGTRTLSFGSGSTWTIAGVGNSWNATTSTNLTVTGTGTISLTGATDKTFIGGNIQTYPTINQGGVGLLVINNSNKFQNITNTAFGDLQFVDTTTNEFVAFNFKGDATHQLNLTTNFQISGAILKKPSTWYMGANSVDQGNNTGLIFTAGGGIDYLNVSYINGQTSVAYNGNSNFLMFFS